MSSYRFKVNQLSLVSDNCTITPGKVNVFIGANNSGKSRALKEIRSEILGHPENNLYPPRYERIVFKSIDLNLPTTVDELIDIYSLDKKVVSHQGGWRVRDFCDMGKVLQPGGYVKPYREPSFREGDWQAELLKCLKRLNNHGQGDVRDAALRFFGPSMVDYSGTDDRLLLSLGGQACGYKDDDYNVLSSVLDIDPDCRAISEDIQTLFSKDVVLDATSSRQIVKPVVSGSFREYRDSSDPLIRSPYLEKATPLSEEGDGFKSFVATLLNLIGRKKPIYLLDEPEAFLHPPYARRMGEILGSYFSTTEDLSNVFISTHSSYLLQGLISTCPDDIKIIRLDRSGDSTNAHVLDNDKITELIGRSDYSPKYLDALFSSEVNLVVAPWDEVVFERLVLKALPIYNGMFVPVNGKDRFHWMKDFYDSAGITCHVIADYDLLNNNEVFKKVLKCFVCDAGARKEYLDVRNDLEQEYRTLEGRPGTSREKMPDEVKARYKNDVSKDLSEKTIARVRDTLSRLDRFGLIVLRSGELESLFVEEGIDYEHGSDSWFREALDYIAKSDPQKLSCNPSVHALYDSFQLL